MQGIVDEERQRDHPQPPSARRVATGRACLGCCSSSPMSPHRLVVTPATQARRARNKRYQFCERQYSDEEKSLTGALPLCRTVPLV